MKVDISHGKYKNVDALLMASNALVLTIIPQSGAKIQSIYDKNRQKEILFNRKEASFEKPAMVQSSKVVTSADLMRSFLQ
jgi:hypothetical protein